MTKLYKITRRDGRTETFSTSLTVAEAAAIVRAKVPVSDFSASLVRAAEGERLSDRQLPWLMKLAHDASRPQVPGPFLPLVTMLTNWQSKAKGQVSLRLSGLTLKAVRKGPNTGSVYLYEGSNGSYAGKLTPFGELVSPSPHSYADLLREAAQDPIASARSYGYETGRCSCCGRVLSDPISVFGGIGPICLGMIGGDRKALEREYKASRRG